MYLTFCSICYNLYNLKHLNNTHGGVLFFVKLQVSACNFTKNNIFSRFSNNTNCTKSRKGSYIFEFKELRIITNINYKHNKKQNKKTKKQQTKKQKKTWIIVNYAQGL